MKADAFSQISQDEVLVDRVFQSLARLEFWLVGRRNLYLFAGPRVATLGGLPLSHVKGTESNQSDFLAGLQ